MATIVEKIKHRLGYQECVVITRDEWYELGDYHDGGDDMLADCQKELDKLEGIKKQLDLANEIIDGLVECIDDEGVVTPGDVKLLARRIKAAVKFNENLKDG